MSVAIIRGSESIFAITTHIRIEDIEQIVLDDIRSKARSVITDEDKARADFLKHKEQMSAAQYKSDNKARAKEKAV